MTQHEVELLKIYVLVSPFLVFALALFVVWLTGRADRYERQRHPAE